jgi:hypothetical protein
MNHPEESSQYMILIWSVCNSIYASSALSTIFFCNRSHALLIYSYEGTVTEAVRHYSTAFFSQWHWICSNFDRVKSREENVT